MPTMKKSALVMLGTAIIATVFAFLADGEMAVFVIAPPMLAPFWLSLIAILVFAAQVVPEGFVRSSLNYIGFAALGLLLPSGVLLLALALRG